jgi:hypothetical protein
VCLGDLASDGQAQSDTLGLASHERLEEPRRHLRGRTWTRIAHDQNNDRRLLC